MRLNQVGEFNLIESLRQRFAPGYQDVLGIGDDCAVWPLDDKRVQMATTDLLIEQIHFLGDCVSPTDLGHKALAVSLSDIAAMGGTPTASLISVGLPQRLDINWWNAFFDGVQALSHKYGCPVLGGDTTRSERDIVINVAVLGEAPRDCIRYRSGAVCGDIVAVTGCLGDATAGLRLLLSPDAPSEPEHERLITAHHRPTPHLDEGRWLAGQGGVHAMMDVSDGLDTDMQQIMTASGVGALIALDRLPLSPALRKVGTVEQWQVDELAATGGEDYVLLCTADATAFTGLAKAFEDTFRRPLQRIGNITKDRRLIYQRNGMSVNVKGHGFDHFSPRS